LINAWEQKRVLWVGFVEIREVDTHPHGPIGIWDHHGVCLPCGYITSRITLAFSSFRTSLTIKSCRSWACRQTFCLMGRASGHTSRWLIRCKHIYNF
jgi:hypothetical protein